MLVEDISPEPSGSNWLLFATDHDRIFARRLRALREAARLTQRQLAERMTVAGYRMHQTTIAKIEAADRPVVIGEAVVFARIIGVDLAELVTEPVTRESHELQAAMQELDAAERTVAELSSTVMLASVRLANDQDDLARARDQLRAAAENVDSLRKKIDG
jgi:transcriptional regulator with XRE-family HTH domain